MKKKWIPNNQRGAIAVIFVILLFVLIGFTALGIDAGRWYLAREKLKEAADAAAMAGVQAYGFSASGDCDEWEALAEDVLKENFPDGYLGCQLSDGDIDITVDNVMRASGQLMVKATACANCTTTFARIFGIDTVRVCASNDYSVAERVPVEIMLVLDRSDSMQGSMDDLRDAAKSFADHFRCIQDVDRMGLISYATGVMVDYPLANNFIDDDDGIKNEIDNVTIRASVGDEDTNMEDAVDQADDPVFKSGDEPGDPRVGAPKGFTDQSGLAENQRVKQFLVFFTDGKANAFRGIFTRDDIDYDAVIPDPYDSGWGVGYLRDPYYGTSIGVDFKPTGDGKPKAESACGNTTTTRWHVFEDYPIAGYSYPYCNINEMDLKNYVYKVDGNCIAGSMAIDHAQELKDKDITIYCIGLGNVNPDLLKGIASKDEYYFKAPSASEMKRIFNQVAMEIKKYVYLVK